MKFLKDRLLEAIEEGNEFRFLNQYSKIVWGEGVSGEDMNLIIDNYSVLLENGAKPEDAKYVAIRDYIKYQNILYKDFRGELKKVKSDFNSQ